MTQEAAQGFGAFGKMPALGDFFRLNTPPGFVRVWDAWLQGAMVSAGQSGGPEWDKQYMSAPIWRFALPPGLAGAAKVIGVLMPSVDRVGRRFPLALMGPVVGQGPVALDHLRAEDTFAKLEDVALAALDDGMTKDRLEVAMSGISVANDVSYGAMRKAGNALVLADGHADGIAPELAAGLLHNSAFRHPSLWSTVLNGARRAMICDGLPDAQQARALFDMNAPLWGKS